MTMDKKKRYVSLSELSKILSIPEKILTDWMRNGVIPKNTYINIGGILRFNEDLVINALVDHDEKTSSPVPHDTSNPEMSVVLNYNRVCEMAIAFAELSDKCFEHLQSIFEYLNDEDLSKRFEEIGLLKLPEGGVLLPEAVFTEVASIRDWMKHADVPQKFIDEMNRLLSSFKAKYLNDDSVERLNNFFQLIEWHYQEGYDFEYGPMFAQRANEILDYMANRRAIDDGNSSPTACFQAPMRVDELLGWQWSDHLWQPDAE